MFNRIKEAATAIVESVKRNVHKLGLALTGAVAAVASATSAHAEAILDFSGVSTAVTAELTPAISAAMPIAGIILAVSIGWKLYKRFTK